MSKGYKGYLAVVALIVVVVGGYFVYCYTSVYGNLDAELNRAFGIDQDQTASKCLEPGAHVVYSTTTVTDRGTKFDVSDDTLKKTFYCVSFEEPQKSPVLSEYTYLVRGAQTRGEVVGNRLLVENYKGERDGWLSIQDGAIEEKTTELKEVLLSPGGGYRAEWRLNWDNRAARVELQVYATAPLADGPLVDTILESATMGIEWGSPEPFAMDVDGTVYIRNNCGCDGRPTGLWKYEIGKGLSEMNYTTEQNLPDVMINGWTKQMIAVHQAANGAPLDIGGNAPSGPSEIHLVDLVTGEGKVILESRELLDGVKLSPDGAQFAYTGENGVVRVVSVGASPSDTDMKMSGVVLEWIGDTVVVDRSGELILYDLSDSTLVSIARSIGGWYSWVDPDKLTVDYIGVINQE
ncbi:MAG: hypothetical protein AAB865_01030 [Patescibacteria group bacterium]